MRTDVIKLSMVYLSHIWMTKQTAFKYHPVEILQM